MMEMIFFMILYGYNPEIIRDIKDIKIIAKKARMLIS